MKFPNWTRRTGLSRLERSAKRLRYLVYRLAIEVLETPTIRGLGDKAGIDHSSISCALRTGRFTPEMAEKFEKAFGRKLVRKEDLINPLAVESE